MDTLAPHPGAAAIGGIAAELQRRFEGVKGLRIGTSRTVHLIEAYRWWGETIPMPMCHTGNFGWSPFTFNPVRYGPTRATLCGNCDRVWARTRTETLVLPSGEDQLPLWTAQGAA